MAAGGVGEASALVSFLQVGFSLATSLTTYIGDVQEAPDEISSLATEIDATLRQVEELDSLLKLNQTTKAWNENGVVLAQKCRTDSERVINKLVKLLRKSGSGAPNQGTIGRQDIDISLFYRFQWPRFKPRLELAKSELERSRINILLVRDYYNFGSARSTEADKARAKERIQGLTRSKRVAERKVRRAKSSNETNPDLQRPYLRFEEPERGAGERRAQGSERSRRHGRRRIVESASSESESEGQLDVDRSEGAGLVQVSESELQALREQTRQEIRQELEREEQARKAAEAEKAHKAAEAEALRSLYREEVRQELEKAEQDRKAAAQAEDRRKRQIETEAVQRYKAELMDKATQAKERAKENEKLLKSFDDQLSGGDIKAFVKKHQDQNLADEVAQAFGQEILVKVASQPGSARTKSLNGSTLLEQSSQRQPWYRRSSQKKSVSSTLQNEQDIAVNDRVVVLTVFFDPEEETWECHQVHLPWSWPATRIKQRKKDGKLLLAYGGFVDVFRQLTSGGREVVDEALQDLGGPQTTWTLLDASVASSKTRRRSRLKELVLNGIGEAINESASEPASRFLLVFRASRSISGVGRNKSTDNDNDSNAGTIPDKRVGDPQPPPSDPTGKTDLLQQVDVNGVPLMPPPPPQLRSNQAAPPFGAIPINAYQPDPMNQHNAGVAQASHYVPPNGTSPWPTTGQWGANPGWSEQASAANNAAPQAVQSRFPAPANAHFDPVQSAFEAGRRDRAIEESGSGVRTARVSDERRSIRRYHSPGKEGHSSSQRPYRSSEYSDLRDDWYNAGDSRRRQKYERWQSSASRRMDRERRPMLPRSAIENSGRRRDLPNEGPPALMSSARRQKGTHGRPEVVFREDGRYYSRAGPESLSLESSHSEHNSDVDLEFLTVRNDEELSDLMITRYTGAMTRMPGEDESTLPNGIRNVNGLDDFNVREEAEDQAGDVTDNTVDLDSRPGALASLPSAEDLNANEPVVTGI